MRGGGGKGESQFGEQHINIKDRTLLRSLILIFAGFIAGIRL